MFLLSIIVPVFNVEKYLNKCIDSLLNQNIDKNHYEIIIVDDESTDNSLAIAKEYEAKYENIKLISQKNKGLGGARNTGLKFASGEYILFLDSDDYLSTNSLSVILERIKRDKLDVLRFNYESIDENNIIVPITKNGLYTKVYDEEVVLGKEFLVNKLGWICYAWQFIIKKDFLLENILLFNESIYFEDVEWLVRVLIKAEKAASIDIKAYNYLQRSGSITRTSNLEKQEKIFRDKIFLLDFLNGIIKEINDNGVRQWCKGMQGLLIIGLFPFVRLNLPHQKLNFISLLNKRKYRPIIPFRYTPKQIRDAMLINISPSLFYILKGR